MLNEMKEAGRSEHPGSVVKKRGSSGCLIIKKKVTDSVRGASDSSSRNLFKEKKRRRVIGSDSESIDNQSEATIGHKSDKLHNGPVVYLEDGEFGSEKRVSKCNGLDVFEFDEYDGFDESRIRKDANANANANDGSRYRWKLYRPTEMSAGSDFHYDLNKSSSSMFATDSSRPRPEMEDDDESDLPLSVLSKKYRLSSNKPIRLQGKNGVLKVMVNNNKQMGVSRTSSDQKEATPTPTPRVMQNKKLNVSVKSSDQNRDAEDTKFCVKPAKSKRKDTVMQLKSCSRAGKVVKKEGIIRENENGKGKESKVKRGSGTEKQILREKIKKMLFGAGWSIDYRPRRNRDYMDAVYISPAGTAYWSIIKAYDALQKEEEDNSSKAGGNFTPLADEILGKLTRQTRKKMEREMKKKRKLNEEADDSDREEEKLNSYSRKSSSKKSRLDQKSDDDDDSSYDDEIPKNDRAANSDGRKSGRCTLLVRSSSDKGPYSENEGYSGKRTVLSLLIDSQVVQMSEHVQYMNHRKTRIMQKGWITKEGIHCGCCSKIVPVSKFQVHAGSKVGQPYPNIYLESGKSLMQCQIDAWNKQGELEQKGFYSVDVEGGDDDPNDDTCGLCGDGGDLICCDGCPSTFHQSCLDIQMLPQGDWHCPNCCCKYCEIDGGNCDKNEAPLLVCCFCQKKYHESCRPEKDLKPIDLNLLFCEHKCQKLHSELQKLFGVKHELDSGFSWSLIHRSDILTDASSSSVQLSRRVECNSMLAVAMSVMDECFLPIADKRTGNNLIRNVVFNCGSNLGRLNYSGFFTAILERGDEIVCAASIRIHGTQLAEMPFIGTRHIYRRQGMCRRLLSAIESALSSLEVETLIIPAIAEHMHTWTDVFGFHSLEESHKQEMRSMNMLVFPGTDMLQKPLLINRIAQGNKTAAVSEEESCVPLEDGCSIPVNKSELVSSSSCGQFSQPDPSCKTADVDSHPPQAPDVAASHATDILCEPQLQLPVSFDSNVEESSRTTQLPAGDLVSSVVSCDPELQVPGKESVSVHDPDIKEIAGKESDHVHDPNAEEIDGKESVPIHDPAVEEIAGKESVYVHDPNVEEIDGKESVSVHDSDAEETVGKESVSVHDSALEEIAGKESVSVHDPNAEKIVGKESVSVHDSALEENAGKESVSVHDSNAEEIDGKESVSIHDSALEEIAGKESVSVHDPNAEEIDGKESVSVHDSALEENAGKESVSVHDSNAEEIDGKESVSVHDPNAEEIAGKESVSVHDPNAEEMAGKESVSIHNPAVEEIGVQNGDGTNLLLTQVHDDKVATDTLFKSDLQVQVHLEKVEEIYVQNGCETSNNTTDVISIEDQAPNAPSHSSISCEHELHCSGKHGVKEDMIQISEGSCETEMNTKEKR